MSKTMTGEFRFYVLMLSLSLIVACRSTEDSKTRSETTVSIATQARNQGPLSRPESGEGERPP